MRALPLSFQYLVHVPSYNPLLHASTVPALDSVLGDFPALVCDRRCGGVLGDQPGYLLFVKWKSDEVSFESEVCGEEEGT